MRQRPANSRVQHGEPTCADYGCRREECLQARRFKQKRNKLLRSRGTPGTVSADRAAAHIGRLRAAGLQDKEILARVGVARNTFYRVLRGLPLTRVAEQRILALPVPRTSGPVATLASVPAAGTHRRLQALVRQGWPPDVLEDLLGYHREWFTRSMRRTAVTMVTQRKVVELYDRLWGLFPEAEGVDEDLARRARELADREGYEGPLAWDDETIEDPDAVPMTDAPVPTMTRDGNVAARWLMGESVILGTADRREVLVHLFEWTNDTPEQIAARLDMTPAAAARAWERAKEKARKEGRKLWRRAYVPRERVLSSNEIQEAA